MNEIWENEDNRNSEKNLSIELNSSLRHIIVTQMTIPFNKLSWFGHQRKTFKRGYES